MKLKNIEGLLPKDYDNSNDYSPSDYDKTTGMNIALQLLGEKELEIDVEKLAQFIDTETQGKLELPYQLAKEIAKTDIWKVKND